MRHSQAEVIKRTIREYKQLDKLIAKLTASEWRRPLLRSETKDPWTIKDAVAHVTHWKANTARVIRKQPVPKEERGLGIDDGNHLIYMRWRKRPAKEVLAWHRQVQADLLKALKEAPAAWFSGREHGSEWPFDLDGHSAYHRVKEKRDP